MTAQRNFPRFDRSQYVAEAFSYAVVTGGFSLWAMSRRVTLQNDNICFS